MKFIARTVADNAVNDGADAVNDDSEAAGSRCSAVARASLLPHLAASP